MAKLTLDPIGSFTQAAVTTINTNMDRIEAAVEKTLSRDGTIPNQMEADLDMNNQNIINAAQVSVDQLFIDGLELTTEGIIGPEGPPGPPGQIQSIVEGANIEIDVTDPANPIISSTASGTGDMEASVYDPQSIADDAFDRANHTGSQLAATISDFSTAADARVSAAIGVTVQAYDADLTAWAAVNPSSYSTTAQIAAAYQPLDSDLTSWAGVTRASGFDTFAATPSSANLRALLTDETGTGIAYFVGGALGTPSSGTLTNCSGLPVSGITASTSTALGVGSLEVGNASDTTISRSAAGVIAVEGVPLFSGIPQNSQSAAYTTVLADAQKHILHPTADNNARTFTIAANASVAYPIGTVITFVNQINTVTISINSDTLTLAGSGSTGSRTLAANGIATTLKITSTSWVISGVGLT